MNGYHGQLRYPRVDRGLFRNLPESLDRTYSLDSLLQGTVVLVIAIIAHRLWISKMRMVHLQPVLVYQGYEITEGKPKLEGLPASYANADEAQTLALFS